MKNLPVFFGVYFSIKYLALDRTKNIGRFQRPKEFLLRINGFMAGKKNIEKKNYQTKLC